MAEENKPQAESKPTADKASKAKAAKAKKEKPPAVEDKPFTEFIEQHFTPALKKALSEQGLEDTEITFAKQAIPVSGVDPNEQCWQVIGKWQNGQRQFNVYFLDEDIKGSKAFSYATSGSQPSTLESFMIDERRVNLDLLVLYVLQRLDGQKWLTGN